MTKVDKKTRKTKRKARIRGRVAGTADRPRLTVAKSLNNIYVQIIDDEKMATLAAASSRTKGIADKLANKSKIDIASVVGEEIARRALAGGIKTVSFDRSGNLYHGRIKALAEAARKAGLEF